MSKVESSNIKIKSCLNVMAGHEVTRRRRIKDERVFAFKLAKWYTFAIGQDEPKTNDQLTLF